MARKIYEQAGYCPIHGPGARLIRMVREKGPDLLCCPEPRCEYRADVPLDQVLRQAGAPRLIP